MNIDGFVQYVSNQQALAQWLTLECVRLMRNPGTKKEEIEEVQSIIFRNPRTVARAYTLFPQVFDGDKPEDFWTMWRAWVCAEVKSPARAKRLFDEVMARGYGVLTLRQKVKEANVRERHPDRPSLAERCADWVTSWRQRTPSGNNVTAQQSAFRVCAFELSKEDEVTAALKKLEKK